MNQSGTYFQRATLTVSAFLWLMPIAGSAQQHASAQRPIQPARSQSAHTLPENGWNANPRLNTKVWLIAQDSVIERVLTDLSARTAPLTHLKLIAQASVRRIPASCYAAGVPLRDLMDGLMALGVLQWRRKDARTLELGVADYDPQHDAAQARISYYGMRVIQEVRRQPGGLWQELMQRRVRLGSLPASVRQALEALFKVRDDQPPPQNLPLLEVPADPQQMSISLNEEQEAGEKGYMLRFLQQRPTPAGLSVMEIGLRFTPRQAAFYVPTPDDAAPVQGPDDGTPTDPRLAQPATLRLHAATLAQALKSLFAGCRLPLIAGAHNRTDRADLEFVKLPLKEALDRIASAYACRWERRESGLIVLTAKPD
jgi:hypothetical protein